MEIGLSHYLTLAAMLFTLGIFGIFLNRKNVIVILMSVATARGEESERTIVAGVNPIGVPVAVAHLVDGVRVRDRDRRGHVDPRLPMPTRHRRKPGACQARRRRGRVRLTELKCVSKSPSSLIF